MMKKPYYDKYGRSVSDGVNDETSGLDDSFVAAPWMPDDIQKKLEKERLKNLKLSAQFTSKDKLLLEYEDEIKFLRQELERLGSEQEKLLDDLYKADAQIADLLSSKGGFFPRNIPRVRDEQELDRVVTDASIARLTKDRDEALEKASKLTKERDEMLAERRKAQERVAARGPVDVLVRIVDMDDD